MSSNDKMLTLTEVGRRLGVSFHMVKKLADVGAIAAFQPGEGLPLRIWESELVKYRAKFANYYESREHSEHS